MRVERVLDEAMLEAIYRLRVAAWRARVPEFPAVERWTDAFDAEALHWAVVENGAPIAAARLTVHDTLPEVADAECFQRVLPSDLPGPIAVMSRLVVASSHAGWGFSAELDAVRVDFARRLGCACVLAEAHPRTRRPIRLQALGFEIVGPSYRGTSGPLSLASAARGGGEIVSINWLVPELRQYG
jgi:GNAT superfamily N-acetyltransferase